ncbi:MAG: hypothetical protein M3O28_04735 [Actinomycetota bacterium]|nr:hypothetical protein [Actinomycetota bacterium]
MGAAIAILMGHFPVSYTKAFALMIVYSERTQRSLSDLACAVLKTSSQQPGASSPGVGSGGSSANGTRPPLVGARQ